MTSNEPAAADALAGRRRLPAPWLAALLTLALMHVAFAMRNARPMSHDEYAFLEGSRALVESYQQGGPRDLVAAWRQLLGVHPPLLSTLGAVAMTLFGADETAGLAVAGLVSALLAVAFWRFARDLLGHPAPELVALLLLTLPLLTALTHTFYIEGLMLLTGIEFAYLLATGALKSVPRALGAGVVLGLAMLAKASSAPFLLPLLALNGRREFWAAGGLRPRLAVLARSALLGGAALGVAWPWYSLNWMSTWRHMKQAAFCCPFPFGGFLLAVATDGSSLLVSSLALAGVVLLWRRWRELSPRQQSAWLDLAALAGLSLLAMASSQDRAVRFMNFAMPVLAALAGFTVAGLPRRRYAAIALAGVVLLLALHQTLRIPGLPEIRFGHLTVLSHRSVLNLPHWTRDGLPADPRPHPHAEILRRIADDSRASDGTRRVGITTLGHLVSQNYFRFHARPHSPRLEFLNLQWTPEAEIRGAASRFEYLVRFVEWDRLYPGALHSELWERVADLSGPADSSRPFRLAQVVAGPEGTCVEIYRRADLEADRFEARNLAVAQPSPPPRAAQ